MHKINNTQLWAAIDRWEKTAPMSILLDTRALKKHVLEKHGIDLGAWGQEPRVVDEKKYVAFLLKFSA